MPRKTSGLEIDRQAIVETFLGEADEGLAAMEEALVGLESGSASAEALGTVFRVVHTIKGNASSLGFPAVAELAHALEDVLDRLRKGALEVTPPLVTLLLRSADALREMIPAGAAGSEEMEPAHRGLLERLRCVQASALVQPWAAAAGERRRGLGRRQEDQEREHSLRVDVAKLDRMLNLTGEIAIAQGRLKQILGQLGASAGSALETHAEADRLCLDLQELVMKARMVPLGPVFRRYVRTVRDVATAHGKLARLVIVGEDVEVDTSVVEHIRDPLTHMIRNSLDHGIEAPEVREAGGKDRCGTVTLSAAHEAGSITIQVADDGAGLDRKRILARARSLGLASDVPSASEQDLDRLIFEPGFSTADAVTELSGRGVGLEVVRRNVEALRGKVWVESRPGLGTTVGLRLPLTLAVIAGLNVEAAGETFVVPLEAVLESIELPRDEPSHADGRGVLNVRGRSLPFVRLRHLFGLGAERPPREQVLVLRTGQGVAGLAVDAVRGESQTVIKPLGRLFRGLSGVSGATILGDGRVALILDVSSLFREEYARGASASSPPAGHDAADW